MKNKSVPLLDRLECFLTAAIDITFLTSIGNYLNYREATLGEWFYLWIMTALALYLLGLYTIALVDRQLSEQEMEIEPLFLVFGCIIGLLVGCLPTYLSYPTLPGSFWGLLFPFWLSILGIYIAGKFKRSKSTSNLIVSLLRILIPSAIALTFILVNNNGFPGVAAPAEVRQQWASKEFWNYAGVVNSIKSCQPIIKRVGSVKFVAPTQGQNDVFYDPGSSGHSGEFTLEVVGEKGIGVANFDFRIGTFVSMFDLLIRKKQRNYPARNRINPTISEFGRRRPHRHYDRPSRAKGIFNPVASTFGL
ncbi:hypothetical protein [Microcoleus sp. D2_18a_D3]|uniref:hypothetical protein n=1 Tax=Microcoleus sp. D2_18a_D3 TaxID=3055330 RepID=UPI002FD72E20